MTAVQKKPVNKSHAHQYTTKLHRLLLDKYYHNPDYSQYIPHDYIDYDICLKARFDFEKKVKEIIS